MEVRRDQRKAVYNFSVHDLVCRNHIDRSGPQAGETRTSTTSRHLIANIYSENMTNTKTLPFSVFMMIKIFIRWFLPQMLLFWSTIIICSLLLCFSRLQRERARIEWSRTFWGIFVCYLKRNQSVAQKFPQATRMYHCCHKPAVRCVIGGII